jgi:hypothetical protein
LRFLLLFAAVLLAAQIPDVPLATFTGTVRHLDSGTLTLARPDEEDMDIICTVRTHYYAGTRKIKRSDVKTGDRVAVETKLDPVLKPEAVNVRVLPPEKPPE